MKGQGRPRKAELLADRAGRESRRPGFDQKPEDAQPILLRQGAQFRDGVQLIHISKIMEMMDGVKAPQSG